MRKATMSFMSVRPSVFMEQLGSPWSIVMKFYISVLFENLLRKFKFHWTLTRITALYMKTDVHFWSNLAQFFLEWEMFHTQSVVKIKTHFMCNNSPHPHSENRAVCEIMWKNMPQMTIWRMRIACWITKATDTHSEYVTLTAFPLTQRMYERVPLLRYTYIVCLVIYITFKFPPNNI